MIALETDVTAILTARLEEALARIAATEERLENKEAAMDAQAAADAAQSAIDNLKEELVPLKAQWEIDGVLTRKNEAAIAAHETVIANYTATLSKYDVTFDEVVSGIATSASDIADVKLVLESKPWEADINDNRRDIDTNTSNISTNTANIADLRTDVDKNTADIADLRTDVDTNTTDIADLRTDVDSNTSTIALLEERLAALESKGIVVGNPVVGPIVAPIPVEIDNREDPKDRIFRQKWVAAKKAKKLEVPTYYKTDKNIVIDLRAVDTWDWQYGYVVSREYRDLMGLEDVWVGK